METQKIEKTINIQARKEYVWKVLTEDFFTRQWYAEFSEGTYADTDWREGSKVIFLDKSKSGMIGKVISNKPQQELIVEYTGILKDGNEDYDSAESKGVQGGREIYRLSDNQGFTQLDVVGDMAPEFIDMMSGSWDRAIEKIRMLSEMQELQ